MHLVLEINQNNLFYVQVFSSSDRLNLLLTSSRGRICCFLCLFYFIMIKNKKIKEKFDILVPHCLELPRG